MHLGFRRTSPTGFPVAPGFGNSRVAARAIEFAASAAVACFVAALFRVSPAGADRGAPDKPSANASLPGAPSPALWDSVAALRRTLGFEAGPESNGACLRDEQDVEFYVQNQAFWTEYRRARTLAIEDPAAWGEEEYGPDLLLPDDAQILRTVLFVLGPDGVLQTAGSECRRLDLAETPPCRGGLGRLRLRFPALSPHSLVRWEVAWREPTATARATHWFGGDHPVLESRFSFVFPKEYLDTDWGQFIRSGPGTGSSAAGIPAPVVQDEVGPLKGDRRYTYSARGIPPRPEYSFSPPLAERVPHLSLLPEKGGPVAREELVILCNQLEAAATLDAATRESLLAPIIAQAASPAERALRLHETVMSRVRLSPLPPRVRGGLVRPAADTWASGCGTATDIAALLVAGLRELNLPARPLLARSVETGPPDTTVSDPSEFDRVLVEVGPADVDLAGGAAGKETLLDASCPICPWGFLPADLQGVPAIGIDRGVPHWRALPSFPPGTNWMRRTVVMEPGPDLASAEATKARQADESGPPPFTVTVERVAFGEPALRMRQAGGMPAPGAEVLPTPPARDRMLPTPPTAGPARIEGRSPLPINDDLGGPVSERDTLSFSATRIGDSWSVPESFLGHRGLLPAPGEVPSYGRLLSPVLLPHTLVLVDSTVIVIPGGWTASSLPEPSMVQGAGFRFTTRARMEEGRVVITGLLALEETRFTGARARDLVELASSIKAKDGRGVILRRN
jgi:hypothetical protein